PLARTLVVLVVRAPRDVDDIGDLPLDGCEFRIEEPLAQPPLEFLARELDVTLALAYVDGHRSSKSAVEASIRRDSVLGERVVRKAVEPSLARFGGGDHGMLLRSSVLAGVTIG